MTPTNKNLTNSLPSNSAIDHPLKRKQTQSFDDRINNNNKNISNNNKVPLALNTTVLATQSSTQIPVVAEEVVKNGVSPKVESNKVRILCLSLRNNFSFEVKRLMTK